MTSTEYQVWLATLTPEQRAAVEQAVGVVMDALVMLEGRMAKSDAEMKLINKHIGQLNKRIDSLERYLCFPERNMS